jgi:hypothetical protein
LSSLDLAESVNDFVKAWSKLLLDLATCIYKLLEFRVHV